MLLYIHTSLRIFLLGSVFQKKIRGFTNDLACPSSRSRRRKPNHSGSPCVTKTMSFVSIFGLTSFDFLYVLYTWDLGCSNAYSCLLEYHNVLHLKSCTVFKIQYSPQPMSMSRLVLYLHNWQRSNHSPQTPLTASCEAPNATMSSAAGWLAGSGGPAGSATARMPSLQSRNFSGCWIYKRGGCNPCLKPSYSMCINFPKGWCFLPCTLLHFTPSPNIEVACNLNKMCETPPHQSSENDCTCKD